MNLGIHCRVLTLLLTVLLLLPLLPGASTLAQSPLDILELGKRSGGIAADWSTGLIWVAVEGQLLAYDAATLTRQAEIALPGNYYPCSEVAVNSQTQRIYAISYSRTYVIDGASRTVAGDLNKGGSDLVINTLTNRVYMAYSSNRSYYLRVLNGADNTWLPDVPIATTSSYSGYYVRLAVDTVLNRIYVTYSETDTLFVFDGSSHQQLSQMSLADTGYLAVNSITRRLYVETGTGVAVFDSYTLDRLGTIQGLHGPLLLCPWNRRLYGAQWISGGFTGLRAASLTSNTVTGTLLLPGYNSRMAVDPTTGRLFLTFGDPAERRNSMLVIQDQSLTAPAPLPPLPRVVGSVTLPSDGEGVAVSAATNRVYVGVTGGVVVYDARTLNQLAYVNLSDAYNVPRPGQLGVDDNRGRVYALDGSALWAIDASSGAVLGKGVGGDSLAVNPTNGRVYVGYTSPFVGHRDVVHVVDGPTLATVRTVDLGTSRFFQSVSVAVNPTTGYAYATYTADDNLHIISPVTDDLVQEIDYDSAGYIAVNPVTNRVYVQATSGGKAGVVILDGNSHAQLGFFANFPGQLAVNTATNRLYGREGSGYEVFTLADGTSGAALAYALVDGDVWDYAVHPGLSRLYVTMATEQAGWATKLVVIQDEGLTPEPTPTATPTRTPVPAPSFTPTDWLYLPALLRM